ncbi:uncharacterized protein LOC126633898 [Malus sylvestris]|uniref:uncharacterized protein LOC126633898 n=1 Tax=Malus sylvestris TaxID=3752 RepID=UPI0021AD3087|nr:uncharacterized protein LOC126633898 [Malus sylvestris]
MGSVSHPPHFDGDNYAAWKAKMKSFLWAQDDKVWLAVEEGWEPPTIEETKGKGESSVSISKLKPRKEWSNDERSSSIFNQRALNALFTAVSPEQFNYISKCTTAKEAWDILEVTHEGNSTVKESKLQHLITKFENITMSDDESFSDFYAKLSVIVNGCHNLGDSIPEHRIVKKILRSLPMRFHAKRTAIKESKDLNTYKLEQLIGSLQTYELELPDSKKMKSIAFKAVKEEESDGSIEDLSEDELVELTMQIRRFLKSQNSKGREQRTNSGSNSKNFHSLDVSHDKASRSSRNSEHKSSNNRVQCHECQGYGHIASECANTIKRKEKKNRAMKVTWSDSDSGDASTSESENDTIAFIGTVDGYDTEGSFVEEPDLEEVLRKYSDLYDISVQVKKDNSNLKKKLAFVESEKKEAEVEHQSQLDNGEKLRESLLEKIHILQTTISTLTSNKKALEDELVEMKNKVQELSIGSGKIDKMLSYGKNFGDKRGLGFESEKTISSSSITRFVKASDIPSSRVGADQGVGLTSETSTIFANVSNPTKTSINPNKPKQSRKFIPICHLCGIPGHIRPKCNKLRKKNSYQEKVSRNFEKENLKEQFVTYLKEINRIARIISVPSTVVPKVRQVWRRKENQSGVLVNLSPPSSCLY